MSVDNEAIREFQDRMWEYWGGSPDIAPPCLVCWKPAVCLHEIEPRSTNRDWYKEFPNTNSVPVCNNCHQDAESGRIEPEELEKLALDRERNLCYNDWDLENEPRKSKSAPPDMKVDGRSVFDIQQQIGKRGKNE